VGEKPIWDALDSIFRNIENKTKQNKTKQNKTKTKTKQIINNHTKTKKYLYPAACHGTEHRRLMLNRLLLVFDLEIMERAQINGTVHIESQFRVFKQWLSTKYTNNFNAVTIMNGLAWI